MSLKGIVFKANEFIRKLNTTISNPSIRRIGDRFPIPRKADANSLMSEAVMPGMGSRLPDRKVQKPMILAPKTLKRLSQTDAITWAIIRTRRDQVSSAKWDIVPKLDNFNQELDMWQEILFDNLNPWGYRDGIKLKHIPEHIYFGNIADIKAVFATPTDKYDKKSRIKWIMHKIKRQKKDEAHKHCAQVKKVFSRPCNETPTFDDLQELLIDDLLVFDAGIIVLNNDKVGRLAEMYTIPGEEVYMYRNEDRTIPEPPEYAYLWEQAGTKVAEFTREELVYLMANPGQNFYGRSPTETAAFIITTSLHADAYNNDYLKFSDVPPGILNLGKDVSDEQRRAFKAAWEAEKAGKGGIFRVMFASGSDNMEFIPLRPYSNKDMQMLEYLKWTLSIKCACFQISPQDIGFTMDLHRTTSEVQYQISKDRGIRTMLERLEKSFNNEIIKRKFPTFSDAAFKYIEMDTVDEATRGQAAQAQFEAGMITLNAAREAIDEKPVPGGDVLLTNKIPGQGFIPISMLEKEADKAEMLTEIQDSQREQAAMTGQTQGEAEGQEPTGEEQQMQGDQPVQQQEAPPQEQPVVEVPQNDYRKLQKVISGLGPDDAVSIKFTKQEEPYPFEMPQYYGDARANEARLQGFRAGLGDSQLESASDVFSQDPEKRTRGTFTILGMTAGPVLGAAAYKYRGAIPVVAGVGSKVAGRELLRAGTKLMTTMPGKAAVNSKIVGSAINFYRGRMGQKPIKNVQRWLLRSAGKILSRGWR